MDELGGKGNVSGRLQSGIYHLDEINAEILSDDVIAVQVLETVKILLN